MFSAKKILFYTIYEPWYYLVLSLFCIVLLMGVLGGVLKVVELNKFIAGIKARRIFISLILIYISFLFYRVYDYSDFKTQKNENYIKLT